MIPSNFNIETAAEDFAGEGRKIQCPHVPPDFPEDSVWTARRRQMLLTVNGWTFSAVWGFGTYCTAARENGLAIDQPPAASPDAEIAVWKGDGPMIDLGDDTVAGWVPPTSFLAAVEAAERDDEQGIRSALVRREEAA